MDGKKKERKNEMEKRKEGKKEEKQTNKRQTVKIFPPLLNKLTADQMINTDIDYRTKNSS